MKELISYIIPFTRKVRSDFSGELEITTINGKKVLDSAHANYSYGALQKILENGLQNLPFDDLQQALVLGMGGGSVIHSLRKKFRYKNKIDAVELDGEIIKIAEEEFEIKSGKGLTIFHQDAFEFLQNCTSKYDLIVVDLFIDQKVPEKFYSAEFCDAIAARADKGAVLLFNLGMILEVNAGSQFVHDYFSKKLNWKCRLKTKVNRTNTLLLAEKNDW